MNEMRRERLFLTPENSARQARSCHKRTRPPFICFVCESAWSATKRASLLFTPRQQRTRRGFVAISAFAAPLRLLFQSSHPQSVT